MRSARLAAHLLAAVALATCSDSPTGPRALRTAHLAFAPVFSAQAINAAAELETAGIAVASIRVVITRPGATDTIVDRVVDVVPGEPAVTLEVDVTIRGTEEQLKAKIQYRDANGTVLYEGEQSITAKQGTNGATEIEPTVIDYVGPGAAATELLLSPADTVISTTTPLTLSVRAKDAAGAEIAAPLVIWSTGDAALATVSAAGVVTPVGPRGLVKISAKIPSGIGAEATLRLVPPPSEVSVFSGGGQSALVGMTLPTLFKVQVKAADGVGSPGVPVTFESLTDGGSVALATVETDADGYARTAVTVGGVAGEYQFRATAGTLQPVTISATALPLPAAALKILEQPTGVVGSGTRLTQPLRVQLIDSTGKAVAKDGVAVTVAAGRVGETTVPLALSGATSVATTADGIATFTDLTVTGIGGEFVLRVTAGELGSVATGTMTLTHGAVAALKMMPQPPTAPIRIKVGETIAENLWLETTDGAGNVVPNEPVRFTVHAGSATGPVVNETTMATDSNGKLPASSFPTPAAAGVFHVVMAVGTPTVASASLVLDVAPAVVPAPTLTKISGDLQADTVSALLAPLVVELRDSQGQPVPNQQIVWRALPTASYGADGNYPNVDLIPDPTLPAHELPEGIDSLSSMTDALGRAKMHVRLGWSAAFIASVRASVPSQDVTTDFTMTVKPGAPDWIEVLDTPESMRAGLPAETPLRVRLYDAFSNPLEGVALTISPDYYGGEPQLRAPQLQATRTSGRPTRRIRTTSGMAALSTEPTGVTSMPSTSTATTAALTAVLTGATATTDATGTAAFPELTIGGEAGWYYLAVTAPSVQWSLGEVSIDLLPGPVSRLAVHSAKIDAFPAESIAIEARLSDAWGNDISDATTRTITWSAGAGSFALDGVATTTSQMVDGVATITFVAPTAVGSVGAITATTNGLAGEPQSITGATAPLRVISAMPSAIVHGAASAIEAGDRQVRLVGEALAQPLLAKVVDASGLPLPGVSVVWRVWTDNVNTAFDTTVTDASGIASVQPKLSWEASGRGYLFEATPVANNSLSLRFQAATRPDATWDRVWFGQMGTGGVTGDWSLDTNWHGGIPTTNSRVVIPNWWSYSTGPALRSPVEVADVLNPGHYYTPIHLAGQTLTITGNVDKAYMTGTGLVRLTGAGATASVTTEEAQVEIAPGASITLVAEMLARGLDIQGSLTVSDATPVHVNAGDVTVGRTGRLDLRRAAYLSTRNVLLDASATLTGADADLVFSGNFEQLGGTPIVLDSAFRLHGAFTDAITHALTLPAGSRLGSLSLTGPTAKPVPVTLSDGVDIQGQLLLSDAVLAVDTLRIGADLFVYRQGGLQMDQGTDSVTVQGLAHFAAGNSAQYLSAGKLVLRGDFIQFDDVKAPTGTFRPGPELEVVFAGRAQNVTFQTPSDPSGTGSYFSRVRVEPEAGVTQRSGVFVTGRLQARGQWTADDFDAKDPPPSRLLDVSGDGTELLVGPSAVLKLARLNLQNGVKVNVDDMGSLTAQSCYNGGAEILGKLTCLTTSDIPLVGSILGLLGSTSPLTSYALAVATESRRRAE